MSTAGRERPTPCSVTSLPKVEDLASVPVEQVSPMLVHLSALQAALAARLPVGPSAAPNEPLGGLYSVREIATKIPYAEKTIRNLMAAGELREGEHFYKPRGRVMFDLPAMLAWAKQRAEPEPATLPLVRSQRRGS